jgi:4-amino-4-deoxy-L-arabinose transferase-like glycosyltransferase
VESITPKPTAAARAGPRPLRRRLAFYLLAVLVCVRMVLAAVVVAHPEGGVIIDSGGYMALARLLIYDGNYLEPSGQDLIWPPGYPLLIAMASLWQEPNPVAIAVLQLGMTGVLTLCLVWLGTKAAGQTAGLAAGWLYALSPNAAFWSMTVMSETFFSALLVLGVAACMSVIQGRRRTAALAAGLTLGAACLVRPAGTLLMVIWAGLLFCLLRRQQGGRSAAALALLLLSGGLAVIVPWMIRNQVARGEFVFSDVAARTFYGFNVASVLAEARGIDRNDAVQEIGAGGDKWGDAIRVLAAYPDVFVVQQLEGILRSVVGVESGVWARQLGLGREFQGSFGVLSALRAGQPGVAFSRLQQQLKAPETAPLAFLFLLGAAYTVGLWVLFGIALLRGRHWPPIAAQLAIVVVVTLAYIVLIPGAAGQARFRVSVEPLLALVAGFAWAPDALSVHPHPLPDRVRAT